MSPRLATLGLFAAFLLAGCATGSAPVESRPSPKMPPTAQEPVARPAPIPEPERPQSLPSPSIPAPSAPPAPTPPPQATPPAPLTEREGKALVSRFIPPQVKDRDGWAGDIYAALSTLRIALTPDNICAVIAVIEQESSFQADPVVASLPRIVDKEIETRRQRYHLPKLMLDAALLTTSPDGRSYRKRIDALRTEKEMNALFEDMISEFPNGKTLLSDYNPVRTAGPMQVSVAFAQDQIKEKPYPYPRRGSIRDEVFSRRGGVYFGTAILFDYPAPYTRPLFRFADFNAGRYSSRNAAFQAAVSRLSGQPLAQDGDLLRYTGGVPAAEPSATLAALQPLAGRLGLSRADITRDLRLEKTPQFGQTPLYARVFALADTQAGLRLPRESLPQIDLKSPKIQRKLTTAWFAERVDGRHRTCLGRDHSSL